MNKQLPVARAYSVDPLDAEVNGVDEGERHLVPDDGSRRQDQRLLVIAS